MLVGQLNMLNISIYQELISSYIRGALRYLHGCSLIDAKVKNKKIKQLHQKSPLTPALFVHKKIGTPLTSSA